ncbi:MAG: hypothetical protein KDA57_03690 [Planctomycetales bacterium]|nr:hypothetical protein [Planctomycetales bacterium]
MRMVLFVGMAWLVARLGSAADVPIQPYTENPYYWQYKGQPVLLLGGSLDDNLFQLPELERHLDEIKQAGGNYIRNVMSDRPDKGFEVTEFAKREDGKFDLERFNDEYWNRFERMLQWTYERDIVVQIEVWDRFDYSDLKRENWLQHPFNPQNNIQYNHKESGLRKTYRKHPGANENPFFYTVPALKNNEIVLKYQRAKIDKMLSYSLNYPHVLYCMDNETSGSPEWGAYWATYIRQQAQQQGKVVQTTEMWDSWDLDHAHHSATFDHPEIYSFVDISQNNHQKGQKHWDNAQRQRSRIAQSPRPMNNVKIYGADTGPFGNSRDGLERFWRNVIGGAASSRFHRPTAGLGLSEPAIAHLKSARMLTAELDIFRSQPDSSSELLSGREANEAYLTRVAGEQYALFFPAGGSVELDLTEAAGSFARKWLDIAQSRWTEAEPVAGSAKVVLESPGEGYWVVLLTKAE